MSFLENAKFLLRKHRIFPNRLLGQNFMVDSSIFQAMANYASLSRGDVALDVGAGLGFLTSFLASRCEQVLAVEADVKLAKVLREQFKDKGNVKVIEGDVLKIRIPHFNKVVSIPPYNISSRLVSWLFNKKFDCAVLIFQREFANKLVASVGRDDYGWLTVLAYYYFETELLDGVPKSLFYPQPKVDSVIVRLKPKEPYPFALKNEELFKQVVRSTFTQRNKKVRNAISSFQKSASLKVPSYLCDKRVRDLAPEDFGVLSNALCT